MPNDHDAILLETVKTHRARLLSAFIYGELSERRVANDNVRRLLGSIIVAAVACAGCLGFSIVSSLISSQARAAAAAAAGSTPQPPFASDSFARTSAAGWGRSDLGGAWSSIGTASDVTVGGGYGRLRLDPDGTERGAYLGSDLRDGSDASVAFSPGSAARSGGLSLFILGRRVNADADYRTVVTTGDRGNLVISLVRQQGGTAIPLSNTVALLGTPQPGAPIHLRMQTWGENPTTMRAKAWVGDGSEPGDWTVQTDDETPALQRPGAVGVSAAWSGSGSPVVAVQDFVARPYAG